MDKIIVEKLRELKSGIFTEVIEKINEIENISTTFGHTNLKIHNVSYYLYQAMQDGIITYKQSLDLFQHICDMEYEYFTEWEHENLNYVKRVYIGRTSSFYYNSNWYGSVVDNGIVEELLENKAVLKEALEEMDYRIHDYLVNGKDIFDEFTDLDTDDILDIIDSENEYLHLLNDDLDTVYEIVNEAKKAYDFLREYKTEENEYSLAKDYLENELTEYYSENKAEILFDNIIQNIEKLNRVETLTVNHSKNSSSNTYEVNVSVNEETFSIDTEIKFEHELSETYIHSVMECLNEKINENFEL